MWRSNYLFCPVISSLLFFVLLLNVSQIKTQLTAYCKSVNEFTPNSVVYTVSQFYRGICRKKAGHYMCDTIDNSMQTKWPELHCAGNCNLWSINSPLILWHLTAIHILWQFLLHVVIN